MFCILTNFEETPVNLSAPRLGNPLGVYVRCCIWCVVNHLRTSIQELALTSKGDAGEFTVSPFPIQDGHWIEAGHMRPEGTGYPFDGPVSTNDGPFSVQVVHVLGPIFDGGVAKFCIVLDEQFYRTRMEIGHVVLRSRATFDEVGRSPFFDDDHGMFKLTSPWCIQAEVGLQRNFYLYPFWHVYEGTTRPNGTMESRPLVVSWWNQGHPVLFYDIFVFPKGCFNICVDNTLFNQVFLDGVIHYFRVILSTYTSQGLLFCLLDTQAVKGPLDIFRHFVPASRHLLSLRLYIGINIFHIQAGNIRNPVWNFHFVVNLKGFQPEVQHPLRFIFIGPNIAYDIFC